jgi:hypothetical protein
MEKEDRIIEGLYKEEWINEGGFLVDVSVHL